MNPDDLARLEEISDQAFIEECEKRFRADEEDRLEDGYGDYGDCGNDFIEAIYRLKTALRQLQQKEARWISRLDRLPDRSPVIGGRYTQSAGQWITGVIDIPDLTGSYWQYWLDHPFPPAPQQLERQVKE